MLRAFVCSLSCLAVRSAPGDLVWRTRLSANASIPTTIVWSSPVVDARRGAVFIGSRDGDVYRLDAATGAVAFNASVGGYVDSSPRPAA